MICPFCNGSGVNTTWVATDTVSEFKQTCFKCHGTGEVEQTNEEWFCQLPTGEKAKWLYDLYVNAMADECYGRPEKTLCDFQKWLKQPHREE